MSMSANASLSSVVFVDLDPSLVVFGPSSNNAAPDNIINIEASSAGMPPLFFFLVSFCVVGVEFGNSEATPSPPAAICCFFELPPFFALPGALPAVCPCVSMMLPFSSLTGKGGSCALTCSGMTTSFAKFVTAASPRIARAAASYANAASSAESNVPSHNRDPRVGSLISAANLPHGLCRTPR